jgi:hypothetical protein
MDNAKQEAPVYRTVFQQLTTGKLHARRNCGITSRTRYSHVEVTLSAASIEENRQAGNTCDRCFRVQS